MFGYKNRLLKKLATKLAEHPLPVAPKDNHDIPVVNIDAIIRDWIFKHMFPDAQICSDLIGWNVNKMFTNNGYKIENKTWQAKEMPMYVKGDKASSDSKVNTIPWVGR